VWLWRLTGAGHGWPGHPEAQAPDLMGPPTTLINMAEEAWTFFDHVRGGDYIRNR